MYASYFYSAGATAANILADICAILTGETNKANLSAACDQTNTEITSNVAAGWSAYDNSAGTNARCLRAVVNDLGTQYKYLVIDTNTSGYLLTKVYETWDSGTHSGTNMANGSGISSNSQRINTTSGGRIEIHANARHAVFFSFQSSVWGSSSFTSFSGVFERTRLSPWDTTGNAYPPFAFFVAPTGGAFECRRVNKDGADVTTSNAAAYFFHAFGGAGTSSSPPANPSTVIPSDSSKTLRHAMIPFGFNHINDGHLGGDYSSFADIWLTTYNNGAAMDTVIYNGNTYVIWTVGSWRFAVRKG